jgi:hypothetical protein
MRYCTVASLSKLNPDYRIEILYPKEPSDYVPWTTHENKSNTKVDWFSKLADLPNVAMIELPTEVFMGVKSEVHRSDFIRLYELVQNGGIWSDFDIFYVKPLNEYFDNVKQDECLCFHNGCNHIGFFAAHPYTPILTNIYSRVLYIINKNNYTNYQSLGREVYDLFYRNDSDEVCNIPFNVVYPYDHLNIFKIYQNNLSLSESTIGIHWYAGDVQSGAMENVMYKGSDLIRRMMQYDV